MCEQYKQKLHGMITDSRKKFEMIHAYTIPRRVVWVWRLLTLFGVFRFGLKLECNGINAIALPGGLSGAIVEDMSQVRPTIFAGYLGAFHEKRAVLVQFDVFAVDGIIKAGPAGTRFELGI